MKFVRRRLPALLLSLLLICMAGIPAYAHDVPDLTRPCTFTVTLHKDSKPVGGGKVSIYLVGDIAENDGNYSFQINKKFEGSDETLEDLTDPELPSRLKKYRDTTKIAAAATRDVNAEGVATFSDMTGGLYLVVQTKAASKYAPFDPFLIALPNFQDGKYVYEVTALPKTDLEVETQPPKPLPQTGQLWWPVPMLICGGLAMVAVGFALNRRRKPDED